MSTKRHITAQELKQMIDQGQAVQLIDVRSAGEYAAGHVPMAANIPLEQIESRLDDLQAGPVAILCQSGKRAGMACDILHPHRGDLLLVDGGTQAWIKEGFSTISTTSSKWSLERQVRLIAGLLVLIGTGLSLVLGTGWIGLAMFVGAGLTFAGLTDVCGMAFILAKLPWNKPTACPTVSEVRA